MAIAKKAAKIKKAARNTTKAGKPAVKRKTAVKKKVVRVVKKKAAKSTRKKAAAKSSPSAAAKAKILRESIAELKGEVKALKSDLKSAKKREDAMSKMMSSRDAAVGKFLNGWDKKAMLVVEKSLKGKKKRKSKK
ncbi:MAG: hypothetical protein GY820_11835 [Gammaproteobacteria bacterium]|nr:hypothetical protein [Gammaproteobacteria bacterium]